MQISHQIAGSRRFLSPVHSERWPLSCSLPARRQYVLPLEAERRRS